jgi:phosphatidylserine decarboxylase
MAMEKYGWSDRPSTVAFPVERAGYAFIFAAAFVTAVMALLELTVLALIGLVATFFVCFFFRDPDRIIPQQDNQVVSPADGKVVAVEKIEATPYFDGACQKVSIFMSIFNVHVNRIPFEGDVKRISYYPGKFFSANLDKASSANEHNAVWVATHNGEQVCFVQIAGLIARRIICRVQEGEAVKRGQRFGLICFGSRLDVYLPENTVLDIALGDRVKAGTSVLGKLS